MISAVKDKGLLLTDSDHEELYELLEERVQQLLHAQCSTIAAAWVSGGAGFDAVVQELNAREHLREVANALAPGGAGPNKLRRTTIALALEEGIRSLPADAAAYLAAVYQRTVAFALLQQDPTVRRVKSELAARRVAYLDANVLISAMFEADHEHDLAIQVLEITRSLGAELRVTKFTLAELAARIGDATRWAMKYRGRDDLRGIVDDVVIRSYHRATRSAPGLKWGAFVSNFDPASSWLAEHSIIVDTATCQDTENDGRLDDVRSTIGRNRRGASSVVVETDARNLLHVVRRRTELPADEMGNVVWFVTLDRSLSRAERALAEQGVFPAGVSRLAQVWVDLLSPCLPPDAEKLAGYVAHLVQSQFSLLAEDPMFVKKDFLLTLTESRFDVGSVLGASPERARHILAQLQRFEELETLLGDPKPADEAWARRLEAVVKRALADVERSDEQRAELEQLEAARIEAEQRAEEERRGRVQSVRELAEARAAAEAATAAAEAAQKSAAQTVDAMREAQSERDAMAQQLEAERSRPWWQRIFRSRS